MTERSGTWSSTFEASRRRHSNRKPPAHRARRRAFRLTDLKSVCYKFHEVDSRNVKVGSRNESADPQHALNGAFFLSSSESSASLFPTRGHASTHVSPASDPHDECRL
jgi:hypothetical protein